MKQSISLGVAYKAYFAKGLDKMVRAFKPCRSAEPGFEEDESNGARPSHNPLLPGKQAPSSSGLRRSFTSDCSEEYQRQKLKSDFNTFQVVSRLVHSADFK
ncbi:hypothetical protein CIB48_g5967 [Xylaria polymorpha]|nr:hypothetical protein CIB48_g5967 [Xylaria polymorpha]